MSGSSKWSLWTGCAQLLPLNGKEESNPVFWKYFETSFRNMSLCCSPSPHFYMALIYKPCLIILQITFDFFF